MQVLLRELQKRFTGHNEPWGEFVDVKFWPPIKNPGKYAGKEVFLGSVCDCYQPHEKKYGPPVVVNYFYHSEVKKSSKQ